MTFFKNVVTKSGGYAHFFLICLKSGPSCCLSAFCKPIVFHRRMPIKTPPMLVIFSKKRKGAGKKPGNQTEGSAVNSPQKNPHVSKKQGVRIRKNGRSFIYYFFRYWRGQQGQEYLIIKLSFVCSQKKLSTIHQKTLNSHT